MTGAAKLDAIAGDRVSCEALTAVFALLGKRWSGLIVGTLLSGPARFTQISRQVRGVSERVLSERLNELTAAGLIERRVLAGPPVGVEYRLTQRGEALRPALDQLGLWATEHLGTATSPDMQRRTTGSCAPLEESDTT
ncbi:MAG: helix-turn-helix domain-containing protein [Acidimicrobiales bacterium]|jgi:DNA-binding HxlR family transcriptional regulator